MPMNTMLVTRCGASRSSCVAAGKPAAASMRAACTTCSTISAADMLRVRPAWPVAQNGQFMPQPACDGDAERDAARVAHEHRLDEGAVVQPPDRLDGRPVVGGAACAPGRSAGRQQVARRARRGSPWAGRSCPRATPRAARSSGSRAAWRGSPCAPAPRRPPCARPGFEVGEVPRRLAAAGGGEGQLARPWPVQTWAREGRPAVRVRWRHPGHCLSRCPPREMPALGERHEHGQQRPDQRGP